MVVRTPSARSATALLGRTAADVYRIDADAKLEAIDCGDVQEMRDKGYLEGEGPQVGGGNVEFASVRAGTKQGGSDTYATPRYYEDTIFQGVSGGSAELSGDEAERYRFQGSFSILHAPSGHERHAGRRSLVP